MEVDPWAVILRHSRWYLLCWSHTRDARRVLRVDRIASAAPLPDTFTPPPGLDPLRVLEEHLSQGWKFPVDVLIDAPPAEVAWWLPRSLGDAVSRRGRADPAAGVHGHPGLVRGAARGAAVRVPGQGVGAVAGRAHRTRPAAARGRRGHARTPDIGATSRTTEYG